MIEKGRGMMEIFKVHGIDMKPKEMSLKLQKLRNAQYRNEKLDFSEKNILGIINKIHLKPATIEQWIKSISADEEVIIDHLATPEKERVS